ncbi:hypothetical protein HS7_03470 [Sulfolobales archaeon HS-7]|nr:hypothetical protein HS7_03470 [Sulfolobales archaeon HS-7]
MRFPKGNGIPIGALGTGKIDFFEDLTAGNITIVNNWSSPIRQLRGFHIYDMSTGKFLQLDPYRYSEHKREVRTAKLVNVDAVFPEVKYKFTEPELTVRIFSPLIQGDLKNSSIPGVVFEFSGKGEIALSFPNIVGSRRWGRRNTLISGKLSGVFFENERSVNSDPAYGNAFLGCNGCRGFTGYRNWIPSEMEGMIEDLSVFDKTRDLTSPEIYRIEKYAREEISGIVWKKINGTERFYLTWFFNGRPHNYPYGHYYENFFSNSLEVAEYLDENHLDVRLPSVEGWLNDAYRNSSYVLTYSWLTKDGRFAVYEDPEISLLMNTIGSMTWDSLSFLLLDLYPELVEKMDEYMVNFTRHGEAPHDLGEESIEDPIYGASFPYSWNDLGPTLILMLYRDYLHTKRKDFLKRVYPKMREILDWLIAKDRDGDGVPDSNGGFDNSYDGTYMYGASSYIASLFGCALKATISASNEMGDDSSKYEEFLERTRNTLNTLWNGKYFVAWRDENGVHNTSLNSQILGEFWCKVLGLGYVTDREKVLKALHSIYELNYKASEYCTVNSVAEDGEIDMSTDQMKSCWPRINFTLASHMIFEGMTEEGLNLAKREWETISTRYPWNQPSKIDAFNGERFGLPYYIGSSVVYLVTKAILQRFK